MIRNLVRLLVLMLVPVLIVTLPSVSNAADTFGGTAEATFQAYSGGAAPGSSVNCGLEAQWVTSGASSYVRAAGSCSTDWNVSDAILNLTFVGSSNCNLVYAVGQVDGQSQFAGASGSTSSACDVSEVCWGIDVGTHGSIGEDGAAFSETGCVGLLLGSPPLSEDAPRTCTGMTIPKPILGAASEFNDSGFAGKYIQRLISASINADGTRSGQWHVYTIAAMKDRTSANWRNTGYATTDGSMGTAASVHDLGYPVWWDLVADINVTTTPTTYNASGNVTASHNQPDTAGTPYPTETGEVIGVGVGWHNSLGGSAGWRNTRRVNPYGILGVNDPNACTFYWGPKLADLPNTDVDEPTGPFIPAPPTTPPPLDPPPPAADPGESDGCAGFSLFDPASWASAGICAVVQAVMWVGARIGDLIGVVRGLVTLIGDLLQSLFVPSDGFMASKSDQMQDAWGSTPPAVFIDSAQVVGDSLMVASPGGGCSGPDWTFTPPIADGPVTLHPFSTCEGAMGTIATIVRAALTAGVYVGGFLVALRVIAAAFGVQLNFGRGDES